MAADVLSFHWTSQTKSAYIQSLVTRVESGLLELLDPDTGEVLFSCRSVLVH
jgi:hypothetical protein